jgi:hypothetical protein
LPGLIKWADKTFGPFLSLLTALSIEVVNKPSVEGIVQLLLTKQPTLPCFFTPVNGFQ